MTADQHGDRSGDRSGQLPKVSGDSWGCVVIHPHVHTRLDLDDTDEELEADIARLIRIRRARQAAK